MSVRDAWRSAFPQQRAQEVVAFVTGLWHTRAGMNDPYFGWHLREPDITTRFKQRLELAAEEAGLSGAWMAENVSMQFDPTGKPMKTHRTDIVYFSDAVKPRLRLTLEFKKLLDTRTSRKAYYGSSGMGRFLDGTYAKDEPFGIMVAVIENDGGACLNALKRALGNEDLNGVLEYVPDEVSGAWLREPSVEMPGVAEFDSQHHRVNSSFKTFMFSHLVLGFDAKDAQTSKASATKRRPAKGLLVTR